VAQSYLATVWDELKANHAIADSFGDYLDTEVSGVGGGTPPTTGEIADAVWDETQSGHVGAGSMGSQVNKIKKDTNLIKAG